MSRSDRRVLVIGGGLAGMEAARRLDRAGYRVVLVEQAARLGGNAANLSRLYPLGNSASELLEEKLRQLSQSGAEVRTGARVVAASREDWGFRVTVTDDQGKTDEIEISAVVAATGFEYFDVRSYGEYGCGIYPGVVSGMELESHLREGNLSGLGLDRDRKATVAFIQCVGSRDRYKGQAYCSRICCMYATRQARQVRELLPGSRVYVFYMDVRAAGRGCEEYYQEAMQKSQVYYLRSRPSKVFPMEERLLLRFEDTLMGTPGELEADLVVLTGAMLPSPGNRELASLFGVQLDGDGFFCSQDLSQPLRAGERVFFAGAAGFPVNTEEAMIQGAAAAGAVIEYLDGLINSTEL
ncbi:MAG: CoB--CoM heterodisulfide reductase iron-sulfur subunit A family protein [Firmicutes bacterium]|nr:CoB--CoM heterodisulfide reductase iron-sulfur subunit A family protein [Bacillota bacterium]